ncbi:MAG: tetraacyldisaccharide 4'-kinase [Deltaproteobacteria bacterium]|nr:tetraacyldisaccharide 4'-kinase [Deltaproteobacteria bacterium]
MIDHARTAVARWLEEGRLDGPLTRSLAKVGERAFERGLARPLSVPPEVVAITVGGATLGGSGKTRVALACTRALAHAGHPVVLVGHGYRARGARGEARVVGAGDSVDDAGDEGLACARSLAKDPLAGLARVVVGPRQRAVDLAVRLTPRPRFVVIDGPVQLAPRRAELALLAVDRDAPWGSGAVAPAGDLRAAPAALLARADRLVEVPSDVTAFELGGERRSAAEITLLLGRRGARLGLFTALARPHRLERALAEAGLPAAVIVRAPDHGPVPAALQAELRSAKVDMWVATEKCATHLALVGITGEVAVVRDELTLAPDLVSHIRALTPARARA